MGEGLESEGVRASGTGLGGQLFSSVRLGRNGFGVGAARLGLSWAGRLMVGTWRIVLLWAWLGRLMCCWGWARCAAGCWPRTLACERIGARVG
jgi:hypothetical protein